MSRNDEHDLQRRIQELRETQDLPLNVGAQTQSRRSFTKVLAALASHALTGGTVAGFVSGISYSEVLKQEENNDRHQNEKKELRDIFFSEILGGEGEIACVPSRDNPYARFRGVSAPSASAIASTRESLEIEQEEIFEDGNILEHSGHTLLYGGPLANIHARQILGYRGSSPLLRLVGSDVQCKFENLFEIAHPGQKPVFRLNANGRVCTPDVNHDWLLLTKIPNIFSSNYGVLNESLIVISGVHGAGTKAIKSIFASRTLLNEIKKKTRNAGPGWQLPFFVRPNDNVSHERLHVAPSACPIRADFDRLRSIVEKKRFWIDRDDPLFVPRQL